MNTQMKQVKKNYTLTPQKIIKSKTDKHHPVVLILILKTTVPSCCNYFTVYF